MTYSEKLLAGIDQRLQLNNKLLNEILESMKMIQRDLSACAKSISASSAQSIKESRAKTQQMVKMLLESSSKKAG